MKKNNLISLITGIIFLIFGTSAILNGIFLLKSPLTIIWFCHIGLIILGIGFLAKNKTIIDSQINILAIPLLIWTADFLQFLLTKNSIFGISAYFFQQGELTSKIITSQHLFTIPLSLYSRKFVKKTLRNSIVLSLIVMAPIFFLSEFFGPEKNINLVYNFLGISGACYTILWFMIFIVMILATNLALNKFKKFD